jgi:hypothetical protein
MRLLVPAGNSKSFSSTFRAPHSEFYRVSTETLFKQGYNYFCQTRESALRSKHVVPFEQTQHSSRSISAGDVSGSYSDALPRKQDSKLRLA